MHILEITRSDLYPFCRKISIDLLTRCEINESRMLKGGKTKKYEWSMCDMVIFVDDDGSKKVLKHKK